MTAQETRDREHIQNCDMGEARAKRVLATLDRETPWSSRQQFLEALGALTTVHAEEVQNDDAPCRILPTYTLYH